MRLILTVWVSKCRFCVETLSFWFSQMLKFQALWNAPKWSELNFYRRMGILCVFSKASENCEIVFHFGAVLLHLFIPGEEFLKKSTKFSNFQRTVFFLRSALQFYLQRSGISFTVRWKNKNSALKIKLQWEAEKKTVRFGRNVKKCVILGFGSVSEQKLKSERFLRTFENENGGFNCKVLIIKRLLKYSEFSKNCVQYVFLSTLNKNISYWLSIIYLYDKFFVSSSLVKIRSKC